MPNEKTIYQSDRPETQRKKEIDPEELEARASERERRIDQLLLERELAASEEEKVLLTWTVPSRPFKKKNHDFYTTVGAIIILVSIILLFAREFLLIGVLIAFGFVVYVLSSVKPEMVQHQISTRGVRTGGKFFRWAELGRFWFKTRHGQRMVVVETLLAFPSQLIMLMGENKEEDMSELLRKYLLHETPEPTFIDNASKWLTEKVPLEES